MSGIPSEIRDFGSVEQQPRQNPEFVPDATFTTEDYYVWTRCDGATSLKEIILMVGFGWEKSVAVLRGLYRRGAIMLPEPAEGQPKLGRGTDDFSDTPLAQPAPAKAEDSERRARKPRASSFSGDTAGVSTGLTFDIEIDALTPEEQDALESEVDLDEDTRRRIIAFNRRLEVANYFELFGVTPETSKRDIKRAYFRVSKAFHPDRFYGKELGAFGPWLSTIFGEATKAFDVLGDKRKRAAYEARLRGDAPRTRATQSKAEYARELFDRACDNEIRGDLAQANKLFAAAVRLEPRDKYLWRAASCSLASDKLSEAEQYAKKAADLRPKDPSYLRLLADVYRARFRFTDAEDVLLRALDINSDNDRLVTDLQADLAIVRKALAKPS